MAESDLKLTSEQITELCIVLDTFHLDYSGLHERCRNKMLSQLAVCFVEVLTNEQQESINNLYL